VGFVRDIGFHIIFHCYTTECDTVKKQQFVAG
jgi:hypothetical protein